MNDYTVDIKEINIVNNITLVSMIAAFIGLIVANYQPELRIFMMPIVALSFICPMAVGAYYSNKKNNRKLNRKLNRK